MIYYHKYHLIFTSYREKKSIQNTKYFVVGAFTLIIGS